MTEKNYNAKQDQMYHFPYHYLGRFDMQLGILPAPDLPNRIRYVAYWQVALKLIEDYSKDTIIDIGTGDGFFANKIAECFPEKSVKGVDISERAIQFADLLKTQNNIEFIVDDITKSKIYDHGADTATCIEVLEHIPTEMIRKFVASMADQLQDDGILIVTVPSHNLNISNIKRHVQHFSKSTLTDLLDEYFEPLKVTYINHNSFWSKIITLLVTNNHFALKNKKLLKFLYSVYTRKFLYSNEEKGLRILGIYRKHKIGF